MSTIASNTTTSNNLDADSIFLSCEHDDNDLYVFRADKDYKLEKKAGIGAYKLTINGGVSGDWTEPTVTSERYVVTTNLIDETRSVGVLMLLDDVILDKGSVVFQRRLTRQSNKTLLSLDKHHVESAG